MAPTIQQTYNKDEKVLCFHHELLYEAKVLDSRPSDTADKRSPLQYRVHYKGWKGTWDDWVPADRLRKFTDENKELALQLKKEMDAARFQASKEAKKTPGSTKKRNAGSDFSSTRGSEERASSLQAQAGARGQKRGRDYELEKVGTSSLDKFTLPLRASPAEKSSGRGNASSYNEEGQVPQQSSLSIRPKGLMPQSNHSQMLQQGREGIKQEPSSPVLDADVEGSGPSQGGSARKTRPFNYGAMTLRSDHAYGMNSLFTSVPVHGSSHINENISLTQLAKLQEEQFQNRPSVRVIIPDRLKALLVDDWENVTKNLQLVPLPSQKPVNMILQDYLDLEKLKRRTGSADADVLEEVVQGTKDYFEKCLGRILLYRFERDQFFEVRGWWEAGTGPYAGKGPGDIYGAEHLSRLFVSMPELIAQTNMDQQSVHRLKEELMKMTSWVARNSNKYFSGDYESASQDYIEKARGM